MLALRSALAWTLLAVLALVGTGAVHRAVHGLERESTLASHAADGHHGDETGTRARESCATSALPDVACALCQGTSASVLAPGASVRVRASALAGEAHTSEPDEQTGAEATTGRGPPARAA